MKDLTIPGSWLVRRLLWLLLVPLCIACNKEGMDPKDGADSVTVQGQNKDKDPKNGTDSIVVPGPNTGKTLVKLTTESGARLTANTIVGLSGIIRSKAYTDTTTRVDIPLEYKVISGGVTLTQSAYLPVTQTQYGPAGGYTSTTFTLSKTPGTQIIRVSVPDSNSRYKANPVDYVFTTTNSLTLKILSKTAIDDAPFNSQTTYVPYVQVLDPSGKPLQFVKVTFQAVQGGGSFPSQGSTYTGTEADGKVYAWWTLGDSGPQKATATVVNTDLLPVAPIEFNARGTGSATAGLTVAGGTYGSGAAQLNSPTGIAVDKSGAVYVADMLNHRVQKWLPGATSGITVAGGNGKGNAANQLDNPKGILLDKDENLYIADYGNNRVQKWNKGATSGSTAGTVTGPQAIAIASDGTVYVSNSLAAVYRLTPGAANFGYWAAYDGYVALYSSKMQGVAMDAQDNLYYAIESRNCVKRWPVAGPITIEAGGQDNIGYWEDDPSGIGSLTTYGSNAGWKNHQLRQPGGICLDNALNLYVSDIANHRIQKWAPGATTGITVAGGNGIGKAAKQLSAPSFVAVTADGAIYVSDTGNNRVQKFTP